MKGCAIAMPERDKKQAHAKISYSKTIAPMLIDNCVTCHRTGRHRSVADVELRHGQGLRADDPRSRAHAAHAAVACRPALQAFSNDRSLSKDEVKTLVHWIEAGTPRGTGGDPLAELKRTWPEWALGEPDLVVEIPAFDVPATGTIPYQMPSVANPLDHDVWVRAVDFLPGDRTVLHHIIATMGMDGAGIRDGGSLGGYVPGAGAMVLPQETGVLMKKGAKFFFQMHYTATGKQARDVSRMGLYFRKDTPPYQFRSAVMAKPSLKIPANTKAHTESASRTFDRDVIVYSLLPHSHFRGKASNFIATYPDGTQETLLSVPNYDFNWQTTYELTTPKRLPAGTKVTHSTTWDNSTQNKANPDPNREVPWGQQTWDEMLYGVVRFRYVDEAAAPTGDRLAHARVSVRADFGATGAGRMNRPALFAVHTISARALVTGGARARDLAFCGPSRRRRRLWCRRDRRALAEESGALVGADQQALGDHVPFDLVEQLRAARLRLEARHGVEREHLERVAMRAAPGRRIRRQVGRRECRTRRTRARQCALG